MDYSSLKQILKDILNFQRNQTTATSSAVSVKNTKASLKRRLSLYRAFSGLTNQYNNLVNSPRKSTRDNEDEVILVSAVQNENSDGYYQTMFLMAPEQGGDNEVMFFRRLDNEFNKVLQFYKTKVEEVEKEAEELSRQMDALIAFRIKVDKPRPVVELEAAATGIKVESSDSANVSPNKTNKGTF